MFQKEETVGTKILRWEKCEEQRGGWNEVKEGQRARRCNHLGLCKMLGGYKSLLKEASASAEL